MVSMKIKISPCFLCGHPSTTRAKGPTAEFNACDTHQTDLNRHAQLLFNVYTLYTKAGESYRFKFDHEREEWYLND